MSIRMLRNALLMVGLSFASRAFAGGQVDWSPYLETPADRAAAAQKAAKAQKVAKAPAAAPAKTTKPTPKPTKQAKRKHR